MKIPKILTVVGVVGALGFYGCSIEREYEKGIVLEELGSVPNLVESSGALFGNESVKMNDRSYILRVNTNQGIYTIGFGTERCHSISNKPSLEILCAAMHEGDSVKFLTAEIRAGGDTIRYFDQNKCGVLCTGNIEILGK